MLFLCYRPGPHEPSARRIFESLALAFGSEEVFDVHTAPAVGVDFRDELARRIGRSEAFVVVISPDWLDANDPPGGWGGGDLLHRALESALVAGKPIIPVLIDGATMPRPDQLPTALQGLAPRQYLEIPSSDQFTVAMWQLVSALEQHHPRRSTKSSTMTMPAPMSAPSLDSMFKLPTPPRFPSSDRVSSPMGSDLPPPASASPQARQGSPASPPPAPRAQRAGLLANIIAGLRSLWSAKPATEPPAERVFLAASAPHCSAAGAEFTAALVAYVEAARVSAQKKLADLGEAGDRRVDDIATSAWRVGAPVTVRLTGDGATVSPPEVHFEWSGRENLAAFSVTVGAAPRDAVVLRFQVLVADVPVAYVPMRVSLGAASARAAMHRVQGALPRSAFASYSSRDAEPVTQRLSTLARWAPGLDIFQDCLDLTPGETFKPQLEAQIAGRDVFLLFWSRQAAMSPWVRWEYTTALQRKGLPAILPMPLEDPAIAPPPPELADQHQRDRFMLAGYGLAKVREEAARGG